MSNIETISTRRVADMIVVAANLKIIASSHEAVVQTYYWMSAAGDDAPAWLGWYDT